MADPEAGRAGSSSSQFDSNVGQANQRNWALGAGALVAVLASAYLLMLGTEPKVTLIEDKATAYFLQDKSVYEQAARQSLEKSVFNRNKLTVDASALKLELMQSYPEIKNVSVVMPFIGREPRVFIEPYKPSFMLTTTNSSAYLLDTTGRALVTASQITDVDALEVPVIEDRSGNPVKLGSRALPSTTVRFAQTVLAALKTENVATSNIVLPAAAYELDVSITGTPYFVKFNLLDDALQQSGTYLAVRQRLQKDTIKPAQYVDVRVPERAYYK